MPSKGRSSSSSSEAEVKGLADALTSSLNQLIELDVIKRIIDRFLKNHYDAGMHAQEVKYNVNFLRNEDTLKYLQAATFENIKGITEELRSRLQRELSQGLAAGETRTQIKKRIADVFRGNNPTRFRFEDRIEMIRRTEIIRAENYAALDSAKQLPFPTKKKVAIVRDDRTSNICLAMGAKYGENDEAIDLDKPFTVTVREGGKRRVISEMAPPFHPNCRASAQMVIVEVD